MHFAWAIIVASQLVVAVEDRVPTLNIDSVCKAENIQAQNDASQCVRDEQTARDTLLKEWAQFNGADRARCISTSTSSGVSSYVELLTCLELARDVRNLPKRN